MDSKQYIEIIDMLTNVIIDDQKEIQKLKQKIERIERYIVKYERR